MLDEGEFRFQKLSQEEYGDVGLLLAKGRARRIKEAETIENKETVVGGKPWRKSRECD